MTTVRQRYQLIPSKNIADQRMLKSDRARRIPDHTQTNVIVLDATFPRWLSPWKKSKTSICSFLWYCWSENPAIWLKVRHNWPGPTKNDRLRSYLCLMRYLSLPKKLRYHLIPSRDIDNQRILLSDWTSGTTGHIQLKSYLPLMIISIERYWWSKHTAVLLFESILGLNWRSRFFPDMQHYKQHCYAQFLGGKDTSMD